MKHGGALSKELVHVYIPSLSGRITVNLGLTLFSMAVLSATRDHPFVYKPRLPKRTIPVDFVRNVCVKEFLEDKDASRLMFIDEDLNPPVSWADLLSFNVPAVSGMAVGWLPEEPGRTGTLFPCAFNFEPERNRYKGFAPPSVRPVTVDACGTGCIVLKREILEALGRNPYRTQYAEDGSIKESEDVFFWRKANALGYRCLLVPSIEFGHDKITDLSEVRRYSQASIEQGARLYKAQLEREAEADAISSGP